MRPITRVAIAVPMLVGSARADDPLATIDSLFRDPAEPLLTLDTAPRPHIVGLGVIDDTHRSVVTLGKRATITLTGTSWKGHWDTVPLDGNESELVRGTRAAVGFRYDLGWLQLDAELSHNNLSSSYASGSYRDMTLRLGTSHRFSRWVSMWLGISFTNRQWDGDPPDGEAARSSTIMLSIGGTFR